MLKNRRGGEFWIIAVIDLEVFCYYLKLIAVACPEVLGEILFGFYTMVMFHFVPWSLLQLRENCTHGAWDESFVWNLGKDVEKKRIILKFLSNFPPYFSSIFTPISFSNIFHSFSFLFLNSKSKQKCLFGMKIFGEKIKFKDKIISLAISCNK